MKEKNELILSTGSVWKISSDTWLNWLIESKQSKIDFYGCSPFYSPFTYQTDNEYRITILEKWKQIFKQKYYTKKSFFEIWYFFTIIFAENKLCEK